MKAVELYNKLNELIPEGLSCDWDNDGLMCCPEPQREVKKVLFTLDVTADAVRYAAENGFDVIISHHPMIFKPIRSIVSEKYITLIKSGIAVMSFHTRLDKLNGGVNTVLAELIGLKDAEPMGEDSVGAFGYLPKTEAPREFAERVKALLGAPYVEAVISGNAVHKVAVCGGDGKDELEYALKNGCDTYVTGSMSYNSLTDASEYGINIIAAGHYYTENPVLSFLKRTVKSLITECETEQYACNLIEAI